MPSHLWSEFMWMHRVQPEGRGIEAHKHCDTRRYLHLDHGGRAWQWKSDGTWTPIPEDIALADGINEREHLRPHGVDPIGR